MKAKKGVNFFAVFLIILLDQASKFLAPRLGFRLVANQGVAFGLFPHFAWEVVVFGLLLGLGIYLRNQFPGESLGQRWGLLLILGGGLSNFFDRLAFGFIRDFIDLRIWPVFNLADAAITGGVVLLLVDQVKRKKQGRANED